MALQCEKRTPGPQRFVAVRHAGQRGLSCQRVAREDAPVLKLAANHSRIAEQRFTQWAGAKPGHGCPWPSQGFQGDHAVGENYWVIVAVEYHFADISQPVIGDTQQGVFILPSPEKSYPGGLHRKFPATLLEPARQRTLVREPVA